MNLLYKLAREHMTMIIATHEMGFARHVADEVIFIEGGEIIERSEPKSFFDNPQTQRARQFLRKFSPKKSL